MFSDDVTILRYDTASDVFFILPGSPWIELRADTAAITQKTTHASYTHGTKTLFFRGVSEVSPLKRIVPLDVRDNRIRLSSQRLFQYLLRTISYAGIHSHIEPKSFLDKTSKLCKLIDLATANEYNESRSYIV